MTSNAETSSLQRAFAGEMKARRELAGLSRAKLAESLGCTRQWLDKVETLERPPSEALADDLDTYFKTPGTFRRLLDAFAEARRAVLVPTGFRPVLDTEREARRINLYETVLIPGLFQTEEYARAVFASFHPQGVAEEQVAVRMARQDIVDRADPPWIFLLLQESVLRDVPKELLRGQCKALLARTEYVRVTVQLIPLGAHVFEGGSFQLMGGDTFDVAYAESVNGCGQVVREPSKVASFGLLFERIRSAALSAEESRRLIQRIMEGT